MSTGEQRGGGGKVKADGIMSANYRFSLEMLG